MKKFPREQTNHTKIMLDHHIQRDIVYQLAFTPGLKFSELKPDTLDNKLFTYHLHKVEAAGYVHKTEDGSYSLTPEGRRLGVRALQSRSAFEDQADSVLFLVIRRKSDGAWLLYRRSTHPLIGRIGFMHAPLRSDQTTNEAAQSYCKTVTGLSGDFKPLGGGYFRVYNGDDIESFTHFTLMVCDDIVGELQPNDKHAGYFWSNDPDFSSEEMISNMTTLTQLYEAGKPFFIERTFTLPTEVQ